MIRVVLGCLLVMLLSACSTVETHTVQPSLAAPFSGTKLAYQKTVKSSRNFTLAGETWFYAFDVPLSLAADTLIFPYDIYLSVTEEP